MFPENIGKDVLPKSYMDGIPPLHSTVIMNIVNYKTTKLMPIRLFVVDTENEIIIPQTAITQLGLLKVISDLY